MLEDGRRVYFDAPVAPYGSMAERAVASDDALFDIDDGIDDATAAALGNSGVGAWLAVAWRSRLRPGETVLVLGATGAVGSIAVQAAKQLGAGRVVAAALADDRLTGCWSAAPTRSSSWTASTISPEAHPRGVRAAGSTSRSTRCGAIPRWPPSRPRTGGRATSRSGSSPAWRSRSPRPPCARSRWTCSASRSPTRPPTSSARASSSSPAAWRAARSRSTSRRFPLADVATAWDRQRHAAGGPKLVLLP